jgi:Domain of unknown function (DUF4347)
MSQPLEQLFSLDSPLIGLARPQTGVNSMATLELPVPVSNTVQADLGIIDESVISGVGLNTWIQADHTRLFQDFGITALRSPELSEPIQPAINQLEDLLTNPGMAVSLPKEIAFIDAGIENYQSILKDLNPWTEVIVLQGDRDGISQITEALSNRTHLSTIHIFSHGNEAALNLGNIKVTHANLNNFADQIKTWKSALNDTADILLYGCDLAAGTQGEQFIQQLSYLTEADIAASNNLTGASSLGGDWLLEYTTGTIEAQSVQSSYDQVLFDLTVNDIYQAWKNGTLDPNNLNPVTLKLDDSSFVSGQLTIAENNAQTLQIKGVSLGAFVGIGATTTTTTDDQGLQFSNVNVELTLSQNGDYNYAFSGQGSLTNVAGLNLTAGNFSASGDRLTGTIVELADFDLGLGSIGRLAGNTLSYSLKNGALDIATDNAAAFFGKGFNTPQTDADDAGIRISNLDFDLTVPVGTGYSYTISQGAAAIVDVAGLSLSAANVVASGDADNVNIALTNFDLGLGDTARLTGTTLNFVAAEIAPGTTTTTFTTTGATAFVGKGAATAALTDDAGLEISNSNLNLLLNADQTYQYGLTAASVTMRGVPGVVLAAQSVVVSGGSDDPSVAKLGQFTLNLANDVVLSGNELGFVTDGDQTALGGTNLAAFVGNGYGTASPIGLGISNANVAMILKEKGAGEHAYALKLEGAAALLGVPDVKVAGSVSVALNRLGTGIDAVIPTETGTIPLVFSASEANLTRIKGLLNIDLADFAALSGEFSFEKTADALLIGATNASAFVGTGSSGIAISNANLGLLVETDRANAFALIANGEVAITGVQDLTGTGKVTLAVNLTGTAIDQIITTPGGNAAINFKDGNALTQVSGLMDLQVAGYAKIKGAVKVNKKVTTTGNDTATQLLIGVTDATAFVGSGFGTADATGFELRDGRLGLVIETDTTQGTVTRQGFALVGSGLAGLIGVDQVALTGGAKIAVNRMDQPVDVTIDTLTGSVAVKFDSAADVTRVTGSGSLNLMGVVQASGDFGIDKTEVTTGNTKKTKLLLGMADAGVFVGAEGGTAAAAGLQIQHAELGLAVFAEQNLTTGQGNSQYAFTAKGAAGLVGVNDLTLEGDLAVRINRTGGLVDETVSVGLGNQSVNIKFGLGQENQTRVEGIAHLNAGSALAFGGAFSMEWFTLQTPGAIGLTSNITLDNIKLSKYQTQLDESLYQDLRAQLAAEKARIDATGSITKSITAVVNAWAFNEDTIDLVHDQINLETPHGLAEGQKVVYGVTGGNAIGGLTNGQEYYVHVIDADTFQLRSIVGGTAIDLTTLGSGQQQIKSILEFPATNGIAVDTQNEQLIFATAHGFTNGAIVQYETGENSAIGGLHNNTRYQVAVVDANRIQLRDILTGNIIDLTADSKGQHSLRELTTVTVPGRIHGGTVNVINDTINFTSNHYLQTGDKIQYYRPVGSGSAAIGGTLDALLTSTDVHTYLVEVIDPKTIRLLSSQSKNRGQLIDLTSTGSGLQVFTLIESATSGRDLSFHSRSDLTVKADGQTAKLPYAHGLQTGQAVTIQLDPTQSSGISPIVGLEAQKYSTQPQVYGPGQQYIYYVKRINDTELKFATSLADLSNNRFIDLGIDPKGNRFRIISTWSLGGSTPPVTETRLGNAFVFNPQNNITVDVVADRIILPTPSDLKDLLLCWH